MNDYFVKYRPFLLFLGKFLLIYVILTFVYQSYLNSFDKTTFEVDGITNFVARQTQSLIHVFNDDVTIAPHLKQASVKLIYNGKFVARVVEGCNAMSIMILFIAFVVAFTGKLKQTFLFIIAGCLLIHLLNVTRIAALAWALFHFPKQEDLLHGVIFPLFIYGVVFILWIIWVNNFSFYAQKSLQKLD